MAKLTILLPTARDSCGRAVVVSARGQLLLGPFRALGTASRYVSSRRGNPTHDRRMPFGDPPCGRYLIAGVLPPGSTHRRPGRFGKLGALVLQPDDGEAMDALARGRSQVVLHGGPMGAGGRRLRRTRGGLRVSDRDLAALFAAINQAQASGDPVSSVEVIDVPRLASTAADEPARGRALRRSDGKLGDGSMSTATPPRSARLVSSKPDPVLASAAALALFGVSRGPSSRRQFLGVALAAVGGLFVASCDKPAACVPASCDPKDPNCEVPACGDDYAGSG